MIRACLLEGRALYWMKSSHSGRMTFINNTKYRTKYNNVMFHLRFPPGPARAKICMRYVQSRIGKIYYSIIILVWNSKNNENTMNKPEVV